MKRFIASALAAALCVVTFSGCAVEKPELPLIPISTPASSSAVKSTTSTTSSSSANTSSASSSVPTTASTTEPPIGSVPASSITSEPAVISTIPNSPESTFSESPSLPDPEPVYTYTSLLDNYRAKWGYNQLNTRQKKIYERLYTASESNSGSEVFVQDLNVHTSDVSTAFWAFDYDNPQFLELGSGFQMKVLANDQTSVISVLILFGRTPAEVSNSLFEDFADDIIQQAAEKPTDYDKLLYIHDRIVDNTVYSSNGELYEYEADGPLVYGKAVCEGYAKAFMYLAQSLGFECVCVIGTANGEEHMWNLVKLYGMWYNVDVTWDDPIRSDGADVLRHDYFLISDYEIGKTHEVEEIIALPEAPNTYVR